MFRDPQGPIVCFSWGTFRIRGEDREPEEAFTALGKDIRMVGAEPSIWRERRGHRLRARMITGVLDRGIEVLVIGTGVYGSLKCSKKVRLSIAERGIDEIVVQRTPRACRTFNTLYHQGRRVALLAHGTC